MHEPARRPAPRADGGEHEGGNRLGRLSEIEAAVAVVEDDSLHPVVGGVRVNMELRFMWLFSRR